ncbi:hypothetical protein MKZ38_010265 [Zalerion maritima]|uniref:Uncharacterized protein n=1 Tax=Zalerion maritima TaxID=339359 RepID=A0AAD5WUA9_9PEZI|nr:hypothetical protein MKZ38_010265 [Zalerion maritima]
MGVAPAPEAASRTRRGGRSRGPPARPSGDDRTVGDGDWRNLIEPSASSPCPPRPPLAKRPTDPKSPMVDGLDISDLSGLQILVGRTAGMVLGAKRRPGGPAGGNRPEAPAASPEAAEETAVGKGPR